MSIIIPKLTLSPPEEESYLFFPSPEELEFFEFSGMGQRRDKTPEDSETNSNSEEEPECCGTAFILLTEWVASLLCSRC